MVALVAVEFRCGELPKAVTVACPLSWELSSTNGLGERSVELRALRRGLARTVWEKELALAPGRPCVVQPEVCKRPV